MTEEIVMKIEPLEDCEGGVNPGVKSERPAGVYYDVELSVGVACPAGGRTEDRVPSMDIQYMPSYKTDLIESDPARSWQSVETALQGFEDNQSTSDINGRTNDNTDSPEDQHNYNLKRYNRVSQRQQRALLDFVAGAAGAAGGAAGRAEAQRAWGALAARLNAMGDGTAKSGDKWKRYWIDLKSRTRARAAAARPGVEERVLAIASAEAAVPQDTPCSGGPAAELEGAESPTSSSPPRRRADCVPPEAVFRRNKPRGKQGDPVPAWLASMERRRAAAELAKARAMGRIADALARIASALENK